MRESVFLTNATIQTHKIERQVLYQALTNKDSLNAVILTLDEYDFVNSDSKEVFKAIKDKYEAKEDLDYDKLFMLSETKLLKYLIDMKDDYKDHTPLEQRLTLLRKQSAIRYAKTQVADMDAKLKGGKIEEPKEIAELLSSLSKSVIVRTPETNNKSLSQLITDALNDAMKNNKDMVLCGLEPLDNITRGLRKGDYVTIAARTGVGKSALCLDFHLNCGMAGKWSMYCSTEMTKNEVILRSVSKISGVQLNVLRSEPQYISNQDMKDIVLAKNKLEKAKLLFYDDLRTVSAIENEYHRNKQRGNPIRLIVIDYIQQMQSDSRKSSRNEELSEISNRLMKLAVEEQITVVICAQLNRTSDMYSEPELSQIKDCGSIEQDSTIVIGINKEKNDVTKRITHVHVLKHRNGVPDSCKLIFYGSSMRWYPA